MSLSTLRLDRLTDRATQLVRVVRQEVRQVRILRIAPVSFHGIEIGSVGRQPLEADVAASLPLQVLHGRAMSRQAIENYYDRPLQFVSQLPEELHHVRSANVLIQNVEAQIEPF